MSSKNLRKLVFISTMNAAPWGGSEELWSETALHLRQSGHAVAASVTRWRPRSSKLTPLVEAGMSLNERWYPNNTVWPRSLTRAVVRRSAPRLFTQWLKKQNPDLICISHGSVGEDLTLIRLCAESGLPYTIVVHANADYMWPDEGRAREFIEFYGRASRVFFVSNGNRTMLETQIGHEFTNAEIIRNPFNVRRDVMVPWPTESNPLNLACVGRLEPAAKGQDLLLRVLAKEPWRSRPLTLSFFGKGCAEDNLRRLTKHLKLDEHVKFYGHIKGIEGLWAKHHALIQPSRFEGLPITIVEAMHCGRMVIVTDVAGNAEVVQDGVNGFVAEAPTERHLHAALERAWEKREQWEKMGQAAGQAIRELVPAEPAAEFARKLLAIVEAGKSRG